MHVTLANTVEQAGPNDRQHGIRLAIEQHGWLQADTPTGSHPRGSRSRQ
jgi:hypothetical protein